MAPVIINRQQFFNTMSPENDPRAMDGHNGA